MGMERWGIGGVAYLAVNFLLVGVEARWHVLYRLTMWDADALKTLLLLLAKTVHHSVT